MESVSIVMPIYNTEKFLDKSIGSILGQTYQNFELLLVDDGSTDSSGAICDKYAEKDSRIRVLHQKNAGVSVARNHGIEEAKYPLISFLDSDDWYSPNALETLIELRNKHKADICMMPVFETTTEDCEYSPIDKETVLSRDECLAAIFSDYMNIVHTSNKLYTKSLFDNVRFPVGYISQDQYITVDILEQINKLAVSKKACMYYRTSSPSTTRSKFSKKKLQEYESIEHLGNSLKRLGKEDLYQQNLSRLLNFCIWAYIKLNKTDWPDKQELMQEYKTRLNNIVKQKTAWSFKDMKRYYLFKLSPKLYEIVNYQKFKRK